MNIKEIIDSINKSVEELDFVTARMYIERNIDSLVPHKNLLKSNAKDILNFLTERLQSGQSPLSRKDMITINTINSYAHKFNVKGIKLILKDNSKLVLREDIMTYLNSDAKVILEGMGAITKSA
jgi:hypothetical protein